MAGDCNPICAVGALDCDGNPDDGCEVRNSNPVCTTPPSLGSVSGDANSPALTASGYEEAFFTVTVNETEFGGGGDAPSVEVELVSPVAVDFDLFVTCNNCAGAGQSSTLPAGVVDTVNLGRDDTSGNQTYDIVIEVRFATQPVSLTCSTWSLTVTGDVTTNNRSCN
jgi:hypothetical protein